MTEIQEYIFADKSIHNYARIIGKIVSLYIEKEDDYSHTSLEWDSKNRILKSRPILLPNDFEATIEYHPNHFHYHISTNCPNLRDPLIITKNNNLNYVTNTFKTNLKLLGLNDQKLISIKLAYPDILQNDMPPLQPTKNGIHLFEKIRQNVNLILNRYLINNDLKSEIKIWPHNFDTAIHCKYDNNIEQYAGFAPADALSEFPYFYNSFYKDGIAQDLATNEKLLLGKSIDSKWKGAIYILNEIENLDDFLISGVSFFENSTNIFFNKQKKLKTNEIK